VRTSWLQESETRRVRNAIEWHLANVPDDRSLRDRLEGMAAVSLRIRALWWYWAPRLHARNGVMFRPFILEHHTEGFFNDRKGRWESIRWQGEVAASLDPWLVQIEADGDSELFQSLYGWKYRGHNRRTARAYVQRWRQDLLKRFNVDSPAARTTALEIYDLALTLDEDTALGLYAVDPERAVPFILTHSAGDRPWKRLGAVARARQDEDFYFKLYRQQIPLRDWIKEVRGLCRTVSNADSLVEELEKRHPLSYHSARMARLLRRLLEARGLDVVPYLRRHLTDIAAGYKPLARLALRRGWIELWAATLLGCGTDWHYNATIRVLLRDRRMSDTERQRRLRLLTGPSAEWNWRGEGLASVQQLSHANALSLYHRHPELLRRAFKAHVTPGWHGSHLALFEAAWAAGDADLADQLASRYATQTHAALGRTASQVAAGKYVSLKLDEAAFARRAAAVLTRIPARSIFDYDWLIRCNTLARLLFERSLCSFLEVPEALGELLECAEIHVQHLGYRVLGLADPRAAEQAGRHLELLLGTLLRPLHRRTRLAAFAALLNAARQEDDAHRIVERAREALTLPDQHYPKEQLVGLIGTILARHPQLAQSAERPVIHRRASGSGMQRA
jgi:hypothetical protein